MKIPHKAHREVTQKMPAFNPQKPVTGSRPAFNSASSFSSKEVETSSARASRLNGAPPPPPAKAYGDAAFWGFANDKIDAPLKLQADGQPKSAKYTFAQAAQKYGMPQND